jgi:CBS domain-containing protein
MRIERPSPPEHEVTARVLQAFEALAGRLARGEAKGSELAGALAFLYAFIARRGEGQTDDVPVSIVAATVGEGPGREVLIALARAIEHTCRDREPIVVAARTAADVMRPVPPTLAPTDSLAHAMERMQAIGIRELPVVADHALVGILTQTDVAPHAGHWEWTPTRSAMTPDPETVPPDTSVGAVARLLSERGFNAVPVVAGGVPVGMVARRDLVRLLARDR